MMMMHSERITGVTPQTMRCRQSSSDDQTHVTIGSEPHHITPNEMWELASDGDSRANEVNGGAGR